MKLRLFFANLCLLQCVVAAVPEAGNFKLAPEVVKNAAAKIDSLVEAGLVKGGGRLNPLANDEVFVRRVSLDIAGRIPTAEETTAFLNDHALNKRAVLIDKLLLSSGYRSQMFNWLADMLRVKDTYSYKISSYSYQKWLKDQLAANRPWNEMVSEMLTAEGSMASSAPAGYLLRDRGMPLDGLANTLTIFLGANVSCAQCHNHPFADWTQKQFFEMAAFFGATEVNDSDPRKIAKRLASESITKPQYVALIAPNLAAVRTLPEQMLVFPEDYAYKNAKPGSKVTPTLITWPEQKQPFGQTVSTMARPGAAVAKAPTLRQQFAAWMTAPQNPRFATAVANRLWKKNLGIAVKEPVDDLDELTTSSNPELLQFLTMAMGSVRFDLREYQRLVFNSRTYQAVASPTPAPSDPPYRFPGPVLRRMSAEQAWDSVLTLAIGTEVEKYQTDRSDEVTRYRIPGDKVTNEAIVATAKTFFTEGAGSETKAEARQKRKASASDDDEPVVPKIQGLSMARASELQQPAKDSHFLRMFGQSERTQVDDSSREGGIPQVLSLMNGDVPQVLTDGKSMLMKKLGEQRSVDTKVQALYLGFFGRKPAGVESSRVQQALRDGLTITDVTWALLNSPEFLFVQ